MPNRRANDGLNAQLSSPAPGGFERTARLRRAWRKLFRSAHAVFSGEASWERRAPGMRSSEAEAAIEEERAAVEELARLRDA